MGKQLIISSTGFPGTNKTWRFVQDAFKEPLGALAVFCGDKVIVSGMDITGAAGSQTIANGFITFQNEIIPFVGGAYSDTVSIIETIENVAYNVDNNSDGILDNLPGYITRIARCGTGGNIDAFSFTDLKRLKTAKELSSFTLPAGIVIDPNYVHTDYNFTLALLNKLNGIELGAQKNVQSDWNETAPGSSAFIKNLPFKQIKWTYGTMLTTNRLSSNSNTNTMATNFTRNVAYVYPPSGFNISDLVLFMPSINRIFFDGTVDGNDTLFCNYRLESNRVCVICQNSESRSDSMFNYIAVWQK